MKMLIMFLTFFVAVSLNAQNTNASDTIQTESTGEMSYPSDYPEGVYTTMESFLNKKPTTDASSPIVAKGLVGLEKPELKEITHNCFFFYRFGDNGPSKITSAFAVSYKGNLYFQLKAIFKNCNRDDRSETSTWENSFVRVMFGGENYLYTEAELANGWTVGLTAYAKGSMQSVLKGKGVVWDVKKKEFNIFKNCKDFNEFISSVKPEAVQDCKQKTTDGYAIRNILFSIR